jgi:hypothetical protein
MIRSNVCDNLRMTNPSASLFDETCLLSANAVALNREHTYVSFVKWNGQSAYPGCAFFTGPYAFFTGPYALLIARRMPTGAKHEKSSTHAHANPNTTKSITRTDVKPRQMRWDTFVKADHERSAVVVPHPKGKLKCTTIKALPIP